MTLNELQEALYVLRQEYEEERGRDIGGSMVFIDIGRGWDSLSSVRIEKDTIILIPMEQDSA